VTIPVYEVYKVGDDPYWLDGLDVLGAATGLRAAVVPHWNNAEGGTHDTRFCWQGERRLKVLESQLPDDTFVLGVDEHTGIVIDLDSGACEIVGRGTVVVRVQGDEWVVPTGETITLEQIASHGRSAGTAAPVSAVSAQPAYSADSAVDDALATGDVRAALALVLAELPDDVNDVSTLRGQVARIIATVGEPVDVTETVRPLVDLALELRTQARAEKRWAESDTIRDGLATAGIEVRDTPDGVEWEVRR
jgi:hypothetical protein